MNFSCALEFIKSGKKMKRLGWNGKNQFVYFVPGSVFEVNRAPLLGIYEKGTSISYRSHIDMRYEDGSCGVWNVSMGDLLASDWEEVE